MNNCTHDMADKDTAVADGMCPLCMTDEIERLRAELAAMREAMTEIHALSAEALSVDDYEGGAMMSIEAISDAVLNPEPPEAQS